MRATACGHLARNLGGEDPYKHGLRQAKSPYARYTSGSCMAVRCGAYVQQGGMNRRRAGDDFYFGLQRLLRGGRLTEFGSPRVLPSRRLSHRTGDKGAAQQTQLRLPNLSAAGISGSGRAVSDAH